MKYAVLLLWVVLSDSASFLAFSSSVAGVVGGCGVGFGGVITGGWGDGGSTGGCGCGAGFGGVMGVCGAGGVTGGAVVGGCGVGVADELRE